MPFPMLGAAVAGGLGMVGGLLGNRSSSGQAQRDRDFQSNEAAASRSFTSAQAKQQMDFQQRMSSTGWQRDVADMRAAGLNPALAYTQGGASSPGGASGGAASGSGSRATQQDVLSPAVASAMQYKRLDEEVKNMRAVRQKTEMETQVLEGNWRRILGGGVDALTDDPVGSIQRYFSGYGKAAQGIGTTAKTIRDNMAEWWKASRTRGLIRGAGDTRGKAPMWNMRLRY